ncbi:MAG: GNAT family N-acetyltransferase [Defluviitaleaceae bacterium]|nr:GNAT family N-acetyltransferase [Defluviitaleaceae bacterium]
MQIILRKATLDDLDKLIRLRIDYSTEDKGQMPPKEEHAITAQLKKYFPKHLADNTFIAIFAELDGKIVATAYLAINEKPANQAFPTGITATLLNVLTYPEYRKKGIATKILHRIIEEARHANVSYIDLSSTPDGKALYEKFGFKESEKYTPMGLRLI